MLNIKCRFLSLSFPQYLKTSIHFILHQVCVLIELCRCLLSRSLTITSHSPSHTFLYNLPVFLHTKLATIAIRCLGSRLQFLPLGVSITVNYFFPVLFHASEQKTEKMSSINNKYINAFAWIIAVKTKHCILI